MLVDIDDGAFSADAHLKVERDFVGADGEVHHCECRRELRQEKDARLLVCGRGRGRSFALGVAGTRWLVVVFVPHAEKRAADEGEVLGKAARLSRVRLEVAVERSRGECNDRRGGNAAAYLLIFRFEQT